MAYVITLDIGGTNIRAALSDENGKLFNVVKEGTIRHNHEAFIEQVVEIISKLSYSSFNPIGISIGVPGRVQKNGFIDALPNVGLHSVDLITPLQNTYKMPVSIRNDAEMAAYAEAKLGVGKHAKSTYFVTISTGIGGCLVANGELKNPSVEIGHTLVKYKNNYYEFEKIASGDGILELALLNGLYFRSSPEFFEEIRSGKPRSLTVFNDWLDLLAHFFSYIVTSFSPDVIAITGGVLKSKELFLATLQSRLPEMRLEIAHFDEDAGLVGAACYGFQMWK